MSEPQLQTDCPTAQTGPARARLRGCVCRSSDLFGSHPDSEGAVGLAPPWPALGGGCGERPEAGFWLPSPPPRGPSPPSVSPWVTALGPSEVQRGQKEANSLPAAGGPTPPGALARAPAPPPAAPVPSRPAAAPPPSAGSTRSPAPAAFCPEVSVSPQVPVLLGRRARATKRGGSLAPASLSERTGEGGGHVALASRRRHLSERPA